MKLLLIALIPMFSVLASEPEVVDLLESKFTKDEFHKLIKPIYAKPERESTVLGNITFLYSNDVLVARYKNSVEDEESSFRASFFHGRCAGFDKAVALSHVKDTEGEYYNIGNGRWGKEGWVKGKSYGLDDSNLPVALNKSKAPDCNEEDKELERMMNKKEEKNTYYIDLLPLRFKQRPGSFECSPSNHDIDLDTCKVEKLACSYEKILPANGPQMIFKFNKKIDKVFAVLDNPEIVIPTNNLPDSSFRTTAFPSSTSFKIYTYHEPPRPPVKIQLGVRFSIPPNVPEIAQFEVKARTVDEMNFIMPEKFQSVKFQLKHPSTEVTRFSLALDEHYLGVRNDNLVKFGPGTYELTFLANDSKRFLKKQIVVPKTISDSVMDIEIESKDFIKQDFTKKLGFNSQRDALFHIPSYANEPAKVFDSFKIKFISRNHKKDISQSFKLDEGYLIEEPGKSEELEKLIAKEGPVKLRLDGICRAYSLQPQILDYILYDSSKKTNVLGLLRVTYTDDYPDGKVRFMFQGQGKEHDFWPTMGSGYCDILGEHIGLHQIYSFTKTMSDIGSGPWGEEAWIELRSESIQNPDFKLKVNGELGDRDVEVSCEAEVEGC